MAASAVQGGMASATARSGADSSCGGPLMYSDLGDAASSRRSVPGEKDNDGGFSGQNIDGIFHAWSTLGVKVW